MRDFLVIVLVLALLHMPFPRAWAETFVESSISYRITAGFSVDENAVQKWLPPPWKAISLPKGPLKGANALIFFDDKVIHQYSDGKLFKDGSFCTSVLLALGKNQETDEVIFFVAKVFWPYDDPGPYKNAIKATVNREATIKGANLKSATSSEVWTVINNDGGMLDFKLNYHRTVPIQIKSEIKARSNIDTNFYRIYRDDSVIDLVMSQPDGINRVQHFELKTTIPELRSIFDGSEKLIGISVIPALVRQVFLP